MNIKIFKIEIPTKSIKKNTIKLEIPRHGKIVSIEYDNTLFSSSIGFNIIGDPESPKTTIKYRVFHRNDNYKICDIGKFVGQAQDYFIFEA